MVAYTPLWQMPEGLFVDNVIDCPFQPISREPPTMEYLKLLFDGIKINPLDPAVIDVKLREEITYAQLLHRSETLARHLIRHGCRKGDVVAIFSPNSIEWAVVMAAVFRIGAVLAGINALSTAYELKHQLELCQARFLYTIKGLVAQALEAASSYRDIKVIVKEGHNDCLNLNSLLDDTTSHLPHLPTFDELDVKPEDPAMIIFSSGTTGKQKAAILNYRNMAASMTIRTHPESNITFRKQVVISPWSHVGGNALISSALTKGYTTLIMPRFDFRLLLQTIQDHKLESIFLIPPVFTMLAKSDAVKDFRLSHLKNIYVAGSPVCQILEDIVRERFPGVTVQQAYGLTETVGVICMVPCRMHNHTRKPGSVGVPLVNVRMKIIDPVRGVAVGPNHRGEICIQSPTNTPGYKNNQKATGELIDADGWLHTGDIGFYDEDGFFYIVDRIKELIKYNAYQVAPAELESVLLSHPQVADAGVVGIPDPNHGELPLAWVVRKPGATVTEEELHQHVAGMVAPYKKLRGGIRFVAAIPKLANGKISRRHIREAVFQNKL